MSTTGEHAAVPEKPATFEQDAKGLWGRVFTPTARVVIASLVVGGVGATGTYAVAQGKLERTEERAQAKAAELVDAGLKPINARLEIVEKQQRAQQDDIHEVQLDIRELYRVMRDGRRSERLETPPAQDGGR